MMVSIFQTFDNLSRKVAAFICSVILCCTILSWYSLTHYRNDFLMPVAQLKSGSVWSNSTVVSVETGNDSTSWNNGSRFLFPVENGDKDIVRRTVVQLKLMTEYGKKLRGKNTTAKVILRVGGFNWEEWIEGQERFVLNKCPVSNCFLTSDYDNKRQSADALLISQINNDLVKRYLPKPKNQVWVVRHMESPLHNRINPSSLRGLANWTLTYRSDSTVSIQYFAQFLPTRDVPSQYRFRDNPYFMRTPQPPESSYSTINYASGKRKKVAWFLSNCAGRNGRGEYAEKLAKFINVDIYGGCGKHSCVKENNGCRKMLSTDYKFYLAFENSNCVEYITEKPGFQALLSDVIPVVMGARPEDYEALLPPNSYISVDDFRTPKDLADYLHILDKNDTLYNSYFRWKDTWTAVQDSYWCRLCFMLHYRDEVNYTHWYQDYTQWWNGACHARRSDYGSWQTWRPAGYWNKINDSSVHIPPKL